LLESSPHQQQPSQRDGFGVTVGFGRFAAGSAFRKAWIAGGELGQRCGSAPPSAPDASLPVNRAGGAGDALVHQSSPQIVDSRVEAGFHAFRPHLHPRGLDVREMGIQDEPGGCSERLKAYLIICRLAMQDHESKKT
jgi:hypothetical protein